jgi:hypothetical protein
MLELDVFQLTNNQIDQDEDGQYYYMKDCDITPRVFMNIDSFGRYIDYDGLEYTSFYSGGMEFISMLTYDEFKEMILRYNRQIDEAKKSN